MKGKVIVSKVYLTSILEQRITFFFLFTHRVFMGSWFKFQSVGPVRSEFPVVVGVHVKFCWPLIYSEKTIHRRTRKRFH